MALNTSQSQLHHNFTLHVSTEVIESRILSSIYKLLTLAYTHALSETPSLSQADFSNTAESGGCIFGPGGY